MKNASSAPQANRWERALTRRVTARTRFEVVEMIRAELLEYLDVLTTSPYEDLKSRVYRTAQIQRVADRLKKLTPIRGATLRRAVELGRVKCAGAVRQGEVAPSLPWQEVREFWAQAAR